MTYPIVLQRARSYHHAPLGTDGTVRHSSVRCHREHGEPRVVDRRDERPRWQARRVGERRVVLPRGLRRIQSKIVISKGEPFEYRFVRSPILSVAPLSLMGCFSENMVKHAP